MTVKNAPAVAALFSHWQVTPDGRFRNSKTNRFYTRSEWEIEISYEFADNEDALAYARELSTRAASLKV